MIRYLEGRLIDFFARKSAVMSWEKRRKIAKLLTVAAYDFLGIRRKHVVESLIERLHISPENAKKLAPRVYSAFFENALEMASLPFLGKAELLSRLEVRGFENLKTAHRKGKGVIIVSGHFGLWELIPPWLVYNGFPMTVVVRRQSNPHVDRWMEFMRRFHGVQTTDSGFGLRESLRTLRKGELLGLMSDQDAGEKGIFVPFFGKLASTVVGPAQISRKLGSPIVVVAAHRRNPPPHVIEIAAPIFPEDYPSGETGVKEITTEFSRILENWVREKPEQWFWLHRRWKTRPHPSSANQLIF